MRKVSETIQPLQVSTRWSKGQPLDKDGLSGVYDSA